MMSDAKTKIRGSTKHITEYEHRALDIVALDAIRVDQNRQIREDLARLARDITLANKHSSLLLRIERSPISMDSEGMKHIYGIKELYAIGLVEFYVKPEPLVKPHYSRTEPVSYTLTKTGRRIVEILKDEQAKAAA